MIFERGPTQSNLECFLECTTPIVRSQFLPKTAMKTLNKLWHPWERDTVEYFTLEDLWSCYGEWSAYGAGTPIILNNEETVVQYYVPYLSAIQIFTSNATLTRFREESEAGDCETRCSFSDSCSDESESEKMWRWDGNSSEECGFERETLWHLNDRLGYLYFQYFERSAPYGRVPLMDKINGLARRYPGLMTLRSVDLSPASWMAVAWYPIYHIPTGRTVKDLSACFLTYHTLSSSFQDMEPEEEMGSSKRKRKEREGIALPPFGLATYKMQGNVWVSSSEAEAEAEAGGGGGGSGRDQERLMSMLSAADSWLKQLRVQHHDFSYFTRNRHG
ncbi:uncharacterized protein LOC122087910 [Macadamia integrifolia]|uniref:uncharacterized protein LOC122087910 n=1 Tax=Macadamia integrifolia TaxID=60698 RepID=UPI001C4E6677|nr:uncharacterized protein LOC122087910 [Macadamia integrifolia]